MKLSLLCGLLWLLTGCAADPLGMTTRAEILADAQVRVEQVKAENERLAREAEAQALVDAEIARQEGLNRHNATIMLLVPFVVIILVTGGIVALIVNWRGRIAFEQASQQAFGLPNTPPQLPKVWQRELARRGCSAEHINGAWYIVRPDGVRLDRPIERRMLEVK